jgi:hypothetical protein
MVLNIHMFTRVQALEIYAEEQYASGGDQGEARARVQEFTDLIAGQSAAQVLQHSYRRFSTGEFRTLLYRIVARLWTEELSGLRSQYPPHTEQDSPRPSPSRR